MFSGGEEGRIKNPVVGQIRSGLSIDSGAIDVDRNGGSGNRREMAGPLVWRQVEPKNGWFCDSW